MRLKTLLRCALLLSCFFTSDKLFSQNFLPTNLPGLMLWLRADTGITQGANGVSTWKDLSGHGYDAVQNTSANQPDSSNPAELCGKPALFFNGTSDFLRGPLIPGLGDSSISLFVVAKLNAINLNRPMFTAGGAFGLILWHTAANLQFRNNNVIVTGGASTTQYYLFTAKKNVGVGDTVYRNGIFAGGLGGNSGNAFSDTTHYGIGREAAFSQFFSGYIAEMVMYSNALTPTQRQTVEKYLFDKYAPPPALGSDTTIAFGFCPIVLATANTCYASYLWSTGKPRNRVLS